MSASATIEAMQNGTSGITDLEIQDVDRLQVKIGGQIKEYDPSSVFSRQELTFLDRFSQFALLAAREAVAQSGYVFDDDTAANTGVVMGTAGGGLQTQDENYRAVFQDGKNRVHPFVVPRLMSNSAASQISMEFGIRGPSYSVSTACASSNHAIGQAYQMIRSGMTSVMLAGGSESMLCFGGLKAWEGLRVMSSDGCRPFCATRNGMVQGEGAGVFVLESYDHAINRGAEILAEISGFSMTSDATDIVSPNCDGAARTISGALKDAKIDMDDIGYINAHGTGTALNDKTETAAVRQVFGSLANTLLMSSTKSMHGHLMGATGAVELLACIHTLRTGVVMPTIGYIAPDDACDIDCVPNEARRCDVQAVMSNAFAFGGMNAVLVLNRL
jgi:nodulation protein E